ncbi:hypothetical protein DENSPDRAFT_129958 [Dentipellis sp. KUC8613]|nr:hypothetical protein DENSPDRAFT_129958 [Dentipellis sp. KUC8613]
MLVYQLFVLFAGAMSLFYSPSAREAAYDFFWFCLEESSVPSNLHEVQFLNPLLLAVEYFREPQYDYGELVRDIAIYLNTTRADSTTETSDAAPFDFDWYIWPILALTFLLLEYVVMYGFRLLTEGYEEPEEPVVEDTYWWFVADNDASPYAGTIWRVIWCPGMPQRVDLCKFDFSSFAQSASFNYGTGTTNIPGLELPPASRQQPRSAGLSTAATLVLAASHQATSSTSAVSGDDLDLDNRFEEIASVSDEDDAERRPTRDASTTPATSTLYNASPISSDASSCEGSPDTLQKRNLAFYSRFVDDPTTDIRAHTSDIITALDLCTGTSSLVNHGKSGAGPDATANCDLSAACATVGSVGYLDPASLAALGTDDMDYAATQAEPEACPPSPASPARSIRRRHSVADIRAHCMMPFVEYEAFASADEFVEERINSTISPECAPPAAVVADRMAALAPYWQAYVVGRAFDHLMRTRWMAGSPEQPEQPALVFDTLMPM